MDDIALFDILCNNLYIDTIIHLSYTNKMFCNRMREFEIKNLTALLGIECENMFIINCIKKYGTRKEKERLIRVSLYEDDVLDCIKDMIDKELGLKKYIKGKNLCNVEHIYHTNVIRNFCKYGNNRDRQYLLTKCLISNNFKSESMKVVLDILFVHCNVENISTEITFLRKDHLET